MFVMKDFSIDVQLELEHLNEVLMSLHHFGFFIVFNKTFWEVNIGRDILRLNEEILALKGREFRLLLVEPFLILVSDFLDLKDFKKLEDDLVLFILDML